MPASSDEVRIRQLHLRGTAAAVAAAGAPLRTALEQSVWPATAGDEILLLRRIDARGNPREIAARAAIAAARLAAGAVDGWSPAAAQALAVRFSSPAAQTACLLRDLLLGTATKRWYWRRYQPILRQPPATAVVALLVAAPLQLPAVFALLDDTSVRKPLWQALGADGGAQLLAAVARATGWPAVADLLRGDSPAATNVVVQAAVAPADAVEGVPVGVLASDIDLTFLGCGGDDPRALLAAVLMLWQRAPARLAQAAAAAPLHRLAGIIAGAAIAPTREKDAAAVLLLNPKADAAVSRPDGPGAAPHSLRPADSLAVVGRMGGNVESDRDPGSQAPDRESGPVSSPDTDASQVLAATANTGRAQSVPVLGDRASVVVDAATASSPPALEGFVTPQGGLLFLLNFLNLPSIRPQLPADLPGAGWRWLHDLAAALGCPPEGELLGFMARACGLRDGAELRALPAVTPCAQLLLIGAARYGDEVWQATTWRLPARLLANPSHIDLHLRLSDANPAVRRVGLDIDPGWLPWLGRVVAFHYGSGLEP